MIVAGNDHGGHTGCRYGAATSATRSAQRRAMRASVTSSGLLEDFRRRASSRKLRIDSRRMSSGSGLPSAVAFSMKSEARGLRCDAAIKVRSLPIQIAALHPTSVVSYLEFSINPARIFDRSLRWGSRGELFKLVCGSIER
jgi:hypothetical protein